MHGLSTRDVKAFNEAVLGLHAVQRRSEFASRLLSIMGTLLGGDMFVMNWVDPRVSISLAAQYSSAIVTPEVNSLMCTILPEQYPNWLQNFGHPHSPADLISKRDWEQRDLFWIFNEVAMSDALCLDISLSPSLTLMLVDRRGGYGSYSEAERLKLKLLGPHVRQIYHRLQAQGELAAPDEPVRRHGSVTVNAAGGCREWTGDARELLARYGQTVERDVLPEEVLLWFQHQRRSLENPATPTSGTQPLLFHRAGHVLHLHFVCVQGIRQYYVTLRETAAPAKSTDPLARLGVSRRESEVLLWMAQGKTNAEIAAILGVSRGTVKRHLENVYPKLGVENRHSATLLMLQMQNSLARNAVPE
jgi:DNA-binding CsgD family transcriptional regulator